MDPFRHPDLIDVSRRLRLQLAEVLEAEQEAAAITLRRRSTIRDRLLDAEDREELVRVTPIEGGARTGTVASVGADHVVLDAGTTAVYVTLTHIAIIESVSR